MKRFIGLLFLASLPYLNLAYAQNIPSVQNLARCWLIATEASTIPDMKDTALVIKDTIESKGHKIYGENLIVAIKKDKEAFQSLDGQTKVNQFFDCLPSVAVLNKK